MSVIVTLRMKADAKRLEEHAASDPEEMRGIVEQAKQHGVIAHRFYASDDGEVMVIDEWPDPESFQAFFQGAQERIQPMMEASGAGEPTVTFWHKLETHDELGWGA